MKPVLLHRGSVKDIYQVSAEALLFKFSNRYSIFDWGEMPDAIPGKGAALALMGRKLLQHLNKLGFQTHYLETRIGDVTGAGMDPESMLVKSVRVPRDDISVYQSSPTTILVPLEVIFRFGAPKGSSLLKRFKTEADWTAAGFDRAYLEGETFSEIKIDFTTKLERMDRVLTPAEAKKLAGMSDSEWAELNLKTTQIAGEMKKVFASFGAILWDGKFEFAFDQNRKIMLVDSIGLDEMRLTFEGNPLSKELLRQFYLQSSWYAALNRAKETHPKDFKEHCQKNLNESPKPLPASVVTAISELYQAVADLILCDEAAKPALKAKLRTALQHMVNKP
jgi:phosphoribosylaminoimidazole-succinocarboxamide synthase